jgi:hypothetical protein
MQAVDKRREVVDGLSVDDARECLALLFEEDLRHFQALHGLSDTPVGPDSPGRRWLSRLLPKLRDDEVRREWEQVLHDERSIVRNRAEHSVQVPRRQSA